MCEPHSQSLKGVYYNCEEVERGYWDPDAPNVLNALVLIKAHPGCKGIARVYLRAAITTLCDNAQHGNNCCRNIKIKHILQLLG